METIRMYDALFKISFPLKDFGNKQIGGYGGPQLSRQNQKPHGKNKNVTAKPKTSWQKQNTSR